jgi:hypothetical protein
MTIPLKTVEINQTTKSCPVCKWTPARVETRYSDLVDHLKTTHHMGQPVFGVKHIFVTGFGPQECKTANFIR